MAIKIKRGPSFLIFKGYNNKYIIIQIFLLRLIYKSKN